ncbi:hypothetical protein FNV43_RR22953 [Rhamnella rubrinervis]|uniref:Cysteine-rich transmembrane domain-containing protein n=1 Tax=Rhamnella rubrinervis TaxID=2594499 RepID=A0A8K0DSG8_9ROSA|nr:hypothetical protein FNV43_RR22953 [Rhamnella rubrinervis]
MSQDAKYGYPYPPPQGYFFILLLNPSFACVFPVSLSLDKLGTYPPGQPPIVAPPQYVAAAPQPKRELGFLEGCLAALCCCCLLDECCCDPSIIFVT